MLAIVNAAAEAYRGVIPADRWHEPYMALDESLIAEIAAGVVLLGLRGGRLAARRDGNPAGRRRRPDPPCVRGAWQPGVRGWEARCSYTCTALSDRRMLVGTWAAAEWPSASIGATGFEQVTAEQKNESCSRDVPEDPRASDRDSVVLADPPFEWSAVVRSRGAGGRPGVRALRGERRRPGGGGAVSKNGRTVFRT